MSYILDALRQADTERERGAVPGLHAQAVPLAPAPSARVRRPWLWGLAGLLLAVLGLLAWRGVMQPMPAPAPQPVATAAPAAPAPLAVAPVQAMPPADAIRAPAPRPAPVMAPPSGPPVAVGDPPVHAVAAPAPPVPERAPRPPAAATPAMQSPAPRAAMPGHEPLAAVATDLPRLAISGSTWSDNPAYRMLVINGQVFQEGQEPAPGVVLERIGPKQAVLRYRGQRHTVAY